MPGKGIKPIYCTSIKQRERIDFRQINCRKPRFKCPLPSALRAYKSLRTAVKSSQPRCDCCCFQRQVPHFSTAKVVIPFEYTKIWFDLFIVLALQQSTINIVLHRVFVRIRNGDILFAEDDLSAFNDFDVMEIDDEGAVSAHKPIGR